MFTTNSPRNRFIRTPVPGYRDRYLQGTALSWVKMIRDTSSAHFRGSGWGVSPSGYAAYSLDWAWPVPVAGGGRGRCTRVKGIHRPSDLRSTGAPKLRARCPPAARSLKPAREYTSPDRRDLPPSPRSPLMYFHSSPVQSQAGRSGLVSNAAGLGGKRTWEAHPRREPHMIEQPVLTHMIICTRSYATCPTMFGHTPGFGTQCDE